MSGAATSTPITSTVQIGGGGYIIDSNNSVQGTFTLTSADNPLFITDRQRHVNSFGRRRYRWRLGRRLADHEFRNGLVD